MKRDKDLVWLLEQETGPHTHTHTQTFSRTHTHTNISIFGDRSCSLQPYFPPLPTLAPSPRFQTSTHSESLPSYIRSLRWQEKGWLLMPARYKYYDSYMNSAAEHSRICTVCAAERFRPSRPIHHTHTNKQCRSEILTSQIETHHDKLRKDGWAWGVHGNFHSNHPNNLNFRMRRGGQKDLQVYYLLKASL